MKGAGMAAFAALAVVSACLVAGTANAESMRCDSRIVSTGDNKVEVLLRCGEPFHKEAVGTETTASEKTQGVEIETRGGVMRYGETTVAGARTVPVERWYYNFGETKFMRILTFKGDVLDRIELGDKP